MLAEQGHFIRSPLLLHLAACHLCLPLEGSTKLKQDYCSPLLFPSPLAGTFNTAQTRCKQEVSKHQADKLTAILQNSVLLPVLQTGQ